MSVPNQTSVLIRNGIIHVRGCIDGKRYQRSTKKKNTKINFAWVKKNANDVLLQLVVKNIPSDKEKTHTVKSYGYKSLEMNSEQRVKNTTIEYIRDFKSQILPYFGSWELNQIKPSDLRQWQTNLLKNKSAVRVINIRSIFQTILQDAFLDELIERNPFDRVKRPKKKKPKVFPFSLEEVQKLLNNSDGWFKNYLTIAFFTGMRSGELIALRWDNIDLDNKIIKVRKSMRRSEITDTKTESSIRDIDILPVVNKALKAQYQLTGNKKNVFVNQYGTSYERTDKISSSKWKPLLKKCIIEYRVLYKTRHTFASIMIQKGEEIAWVSKMLGHANINITLSKYTDYIPRKYIKRATFLDDFDI